MIHSSSEELVAGIFAQVLKLERVGREESFFELGGDSLLATQVVSRVRAAFGNQLAVRELFEAPTAAALAARLDALAPAPERPDVPLVRDPAASPELSFAQSRLWFLAKLDPGSASHNVVNAVWIEGELDVPAFERSWAEVVRRHDVLRSVFPEVGGEGAVRIAPPSAAGAGVSYESVEGPSEAARRAQALLRAEALARRPFTLAEAPLWRVTLLRISERGHLLVLVLHPIISDGWSATVLVREMAALYQAHHQGREPDLPVLPVQYQDYARWQRASLTDAVLEPELAYWRRQLEGAPRALDLPTDHPRPPVQSLRGAMVPVQVPATLARAIRALARQEGATPFMVVLAAFQALLARTAGQDDVSVGAPIAGRTRPELEGLVGFFANTLVLRTRLAEGDSFRDLLARVRETTLEAYAHQIVPFERLVEQLRPERDLSRTPLFQAMLAWQHTAYPQLEGLVLRPVDVSSGTSKFDLTLLLLDSGTGEISGVIEYASDLFERDTAEAFARQLVVLLEAAVADPRTAVAELPLLSPEERDSILRLGTGAMAPRPQALCAHHLFEAQAERTPNAVAVSLGDEKMTYAELDQHANRLGHELIAMGVGPNVCVGLLAERSFELVVGLLATLKAGGAYVPLDPGYPRDRLAYMLEASGARVLLAQQRTADTVPHAGLAVRHLDGVRDVKAEAPRSHPRSSADASALAYVIFTSGSTGRPKGVAMPHGPLVNLMLWQQEALGRGPRKTLQVSSYSFDMHFSELFSAWTAGGEAVIVPEGIRRDGVALARLVADAGIERILVPFSFLLLLADAYESQGYVPNALREVVSTAEPLRLTRSIRWLFGQLPEARLFNQYGPSETHVITMEPLAGPVDAWPAAPPIGRPIANGQAHVLDRALMPVPTGVVGELYLGGDTLAQGYIGRPDLTEERFIPSPLGAQQGRLYKTGDRARRRRDGTIECLGRADDQVKIRGLRIEPGEVEAALSRHPGVAAAVAAAVAVARPDGRGDAQLVAYFTTPLQSPPAPADLRRFLLEALPEGMIPSVFVHLPAFPLTPSGKIERRSLPAPEALKPSRELAFVEPRGPLEKALAAIWEEILGVEKVGAEDDFFELGGHSLAGARIVARLAQSRGIHVGLDELLRSRTLERFAECVEQAEARSTSLAPTPIQRASRDGALPLSFAQERLWFLYQLEPASTVYNTQDLFRIRGPVDIPALTAVLLALQRRHEILRTTYSTVDGVARQTVHEDLPFEQLAIDLRDLPSEAREAAGMRRVSAEVARPFDLERGPLLRVALLQLDDAESWLLLAVHHIATDGWSFEVMARDLSELYEAALLGRQAKLPPLPLQYADFAAFEREALTGEALDEKIAFWVQRLEGAAPELHLPADSPRPAVARHRPGTVRSTLSRSLATRLEAAAREDGATLFSALLAAFELLLHRYSGQEDIVVGCPAANRGRVELEPLMGFFVNTMALRTRVEPTARFRELLGRVQELLLAAHPHEDAPFERVVETLHPSRASGRTPLFQVAFVLQMNDTNTLRLSGTTVERMDVDSPAAMFDLTLDVRPSDAGLRLAWEYDADLFRPETVARLARHFENVLEAVAGDAGLRVGEVPLLAAGERQALLSGCDMLPWPGGPLVHEAIARRAGESPDATALVFEGRRLSYGALDSQANRMAHALKRRGIGPESRVALCSERCLEAVVAMVAIHRAGGAYVPLDPEHPPARLLAIIEGARVQLVLTQARFAESFEAAPAAAIALEEMAAACGTEPPSPPDVAVDGRNAALVIYTSGSSGAPKGVVSVHEGTANLVAWMQAAYSLGPDDVVLHRTPLTFDASVFELFWPLATGATVFIARPGGHREPEYLAEVIRKEGITVAFFVPSMLRAFLDATDDFSQTRLRHVLSGGEAVTADLAARFHARFGDGVHLHNEYGPAESSVIATTWRCRPGDAVVPIGRPPAGAHIQVYVLDAELDLAPPGVAGEIYIGGSCLARGYDGRPDLTAERFVPNPFGQPGTRLYRTGDVGRWSADGTIEYLARRDHQVKLRGFRIELEEIEIALRRIPRVSEAAVLFQPDVTGGRLVAFIVPRDEGVESEYVRAGLGRSLPPYMVPTAFAFIERMPSTSGGKIDRSALPLDAAHELPASITPPRTRTERALASAVGDLLGVEAVGADQDFFALGGHSLLAIRLIARIRRELGAELSVRDVFDGPTVGQLAAKVDRELAGATPATMGGRALVPVARPEDRTVFPTSFAQERLVFLAQLEPESPFYSIWWSVDLEGRLDTGALERSLELLIERHEILRTRYIESNRQTLQSVEAAGAFRLQRVDLGALSPAQRAHELNELVQRETRRPFSLGDLPGMRATLVRLGADEHRLLLGVHHITADGWSFGVIARELSELYRRSTGEGRELPPLPIQYADFAAWQRQELTGAAIARGLGYWRERLASMPPLLELPVDRARPAVQSYRGQRVDFAVPREAYRALVEVCRREDVTLFMALLGAFDVLLQRYTGRDDIPVGTAVAGRPRPELEALVGCFVNTLVVRTDLSGDPTFRRLLRRVRESALDAFAHQDVPFERVVEELQPERSLSHSPLCQVMLVLNNTVRAELDLPGIRARGEMLESGTTKMDLTLFFDESEEELRAGIVYSTDLFDAETIEWMGRHLVALLEKLPASLDAPIGTIDLLADDERRLLLSIPAGAQRAFPRDASVPELFARQVERTPDATALVCEERRLTYRQLDERAGRLAQRLRRLGATRNTLVAVGTDRSIETVVAIFAIWRAGAAYLPIDVGAPAGRVAEVLADAAPVALLTDSARASRYASSPVPALVVDAPDGLDGALEAVPSRECAPEDLAYVIYTSGSTGKPKGVCIEHRALANYVMGALERLELPPGARFAMVSTAAADLGHTVLFPSLVTGGELHILSEGRVLDPESMRRYFAEQQIDCLKIVPSHLAALLVPGAAGQPLPRRRLILGGEASQWSWVDQIQQLAPECSVFNHYGPTETTVGVLALPLPRGHRRIGATVPIGRPLANARPYVLDEGLGLAPVGVPGGLFIGGAGVARGYLGRPALTAERFLPDPYSPQPGARMYCTGDRARVLHDGTIEFLGRADDQVKIRGHRVEPGEVAAALREHPGVREAVVVTRKDRLGELHLVGYAVAASKTAAPDAGDVRAHLSRRLPEYMVPRAIVFLDALPLTPNGKLDRRALPEPPQDAYGRTEYEAPRSEVERAVAEIWREVLRVQQVGSRDDFFALGGHSLLAIRVLSRIREQLAADLPLRALFEATTLEALSHRIEALQAGTDARSSMPLVPVERDGELPLSLAQQRVWFLQQLDPSSTAYNVPYAYRLRGALDVAALRRAFEALVQRHETLRTVFPTSHGAPRQEVRADGTLDWELEELASLSPSERQEKVGQRAREEALRRFDLAAGPLLSIRLLRLGADEHVLLLTMHHIISDGWSFGVLWRELGSLYAASVAGVPAVLPPLPVQYVDYAVWQRRWLTGETLEQELSCWKARLAGAPAETSLPLDKARPALQTFEGGHVSATLDPATATRLHELSRREGATDFMTLLAALRVLLFRYTGQQDLCIGTAITNRSARETEGLIGFFINTLVLRDQLRGDETFAQRIAREKETALEAYAHQDVPFEVVVEAVGVERDLSRPPLFQVFFVHQGDRSADGALPGLQSERLPSAVHVAKFDLSIETRECGGALEIGFFYNADLFQRSTVEQMARHFVRLLELMLVDSSQEIGRAPMLSEPERRRLLSELNQTARPIEDASLVHEVIQRRARSTPDAIALQLGCQTLTYRELDRRSNQMAHALVALGARADEPVAVCIDRSIELVISLLAVWKAGAAYLPLDPQHPRERLAYAVGDARARLVITETRFEDIFGEAKALRVDADREHLASQPDSPLPPKVRSENLAYLIYTSGSTGKPKGVEVEHRSLRNYLLSVARSLRIDSADVLLAVATVSFDIHALDLWLPLWAGARVALASSEEAVDGFRLAQRLEETQATVLQATPITWQMLLAAGWKGSPRLRALCGGEALPAVLAPQLLARAECLWNFYGPTETTIWSAARRVTAGESPVRVGGPLDNTWLYVLDAHLEPVPIGVSGELYIGGEGLARGYRGRAPLTAERFVPDPFSPTPGARMYRTGDLVRWCPDGTLMFLGRDDHQVKIRGFRIELGEIEAILEAQASVRDAVVVVNERPDGDKKLVAYVVPSGASADVASLRRELSAQLPAYMLPQTFVVRDAFPLTPSGKVDRKALQALEDAALHQEEAFVEPAGEHQVAVARLFAELLKVSRVGANDRFFALGGHSLLAMALVERLRRELDVEIPVAEVFRNQSVAGLAALAAEKQRAKQSFLASVESISDEDLMRALAQPKKGDPA